MGETAGDVLTSFKIPAHDRETYDAVVMEQQYLLMIMKICMTHICTYFVCGNECVPYDRHPCAQQCMYNKHIDSCDLINYYVANQFQH